MKPACCCGPGKVSGTDADKNGMTKEQATEEATEIATRDGICMVVTFNPYAEVEEEAEKYSYFPASAVHIFKYEEVVDTIK